MSVRAVSIFSKSSETAWPTNVTSLKLGMCILWVLGQNLARPDRGQRRSWVWITKGGPGPFLSPPRLPALRSRSSFLPLPL